MTFTYINQTDTEAITKKDTLTIESFYD